MSHRVAEHNPPTSAAHEQLGALFDAHATRLYRVARRLTPSADDALDLVQETFLKVARSKAPPLAGSNAEEAWLVRVLVNIRRDQWRREKVRRREAQRRAPSVVEDPERLYVLHVDIWQALDHLSPRRRAVLTLHELEGMSVTSIASLLGVTAVTVRWHLARARRELAQRVRSFQGATDDHTQTTLAGSRSAAARGASKP